ncbi:MAG: hypothetical protein AB8B72_11265 [Crocinitomicaceae bacterium]
MNISSNITKAFYLLIFIFSFGNKAFAQAQIQTADFLDVQGEIYDIIDFPYPVNGGYYIIVGDFDIIDNTPGYNNIAFIKKTDFLNGTAVVNSINDFNFISSINGVINTAAVKTTLGSTGYDYHLYIGGDFTTVNGQTHHGIAKFTFSSFAIGPSPTLFSLSTWDPDLSPGTSTSGIVTDMALKGDTLFYSGDFSGINYNSNGDSRYGITCLDINNNNDYGLFSGPYTGILLGNWSGEKSKLKLTSSNIFLSGTGYPSGAPNGCSNCKKMLVFDYLGSLISANEYSGFNSGTDISFISDSLGILIIANASNITSGNSTTLRKVSSDQFNWELSPASIAVPNIPQINSIFSTGGGSSGGGLTTTIYETSVENYKDRYYFTRNYITTGTPNGGVQPFFLKQTIFSTDSVGNIWQADIKTHFKDAENEHLFIVDNILFASNDAVMENNGPSSNNDIAEGLIAYCLEPLDAEPFDIFDTTVCAGQTKTYGIPQVKYADGYQWEYTGTGANIIGPNDTGLEDLTETTDVNSISIEFLSNFTPGLLKVTPYSDCNGSTNGTLMTSNTVSINIISNPLPNAVAGFDTTFNCLRDTIILSGYSDTLNTTYAWLDPLDLPSVTGADTTVSMNSFNSSTPQSGIDFVFQVTSQEGCKNYDTVNISLDTISPTAILPAAPYELTCSESTATYTGSASNANAILTWSFFDPGYTTTPNPITVTVAGSYNFIATDPINGCADSSAILVENNFDVPSFGITSFPAYTPTTILATLDCNTPSITLTCESSTSNTTSNWVDDNTGANPIGNTKTIDSPGTYYFEVIDTINGCVSNQPVVIDADFSEPIVNMPTINTINCSRDTLVLNGSTISLDTTLIWNGPTYSNVSNPLTTNQLGWHYFTVTKADNGCSKTDSINVLYEPDIDVTADEDTTICLGADVNINAQYAGSNLTNVIYNWNNGDATPTATYNSGTDTFASVIISADNNCIGYDTVLINTPPTLNATFQSFAPCGGGNSGKIIASVTDGLGPYKYSINNGAFQFSSLFENLATGTYNIKIADSLGCEYDFTTSVSATDQLPEPLFIFSTYNIAEDTVVLVDVSSPPADSISWTFPPEIALLDDSNLSSPVIILPDTGAFQVTMMANYGSCIIPTTKWIYSAGYDSTLATNYNQNGIKSVVLFPNPNSGVFTVEIEFYKKQRSVTSVQDMVGYVYYWQEDNEDDLILTHQIDLGANVQPGTYVLKVASEFDSYYVTFIVN